MNHKEDRSSGGDFVRHEKLTWGQRKTVNYPILKKKQSFNREKIQESDEKMHNNVTFLRNQRRKQPKSTYKLMIPAETTWKQDNPPISQPYLRPNSENNANVKWRHFFEKFLWTAKMLQTNKLRLCELLTHRHWTG